MGNDKGSFYDTGLICYLTNWSSAETAMNGAILENYVISEIQKGYQNAGKEACLYYYRDKDAKEIDLLMEGDGQLYPIELSYRPFVEVPAQEGEWER